MHFQQKACAAKWDHGVEKTLPEEDFTFHKYAQITHGGCFEDILIQGMKKIQKTPQNIYKKGI